MEDTEAEQGEPLKISIFGQPKDFLFLNEQDELASNSYQPDPNALLVLENKVDDALRFLRCSLLVSAVF